MAKIGRGSEQAMIRLPDGMRAKLKAAADANNRSMNAEIVARLEMTLKLENDQEFISAEIGNLSPGERDSIIDLIKSARDLLRDKKL